MTVGCSVCSHLLVSIYPACVFTLTSPTWTSNSQRGGKDCQGTMHAERTRLSTVFSSCLLCCTRTRARVPLTARRLPLSPPHMHTRAICGGSICRVGFIRNSVVSHAVCSVLRTSFPQAGLVQDKNLIWLGPCFLVHHRGPSSLNSLDLSYDLF